MMPFLRYRAPTCSSRCRRTRGFRWWITSISAEAPQITVRVLDQFSQEKDLDLKKPIRFCESADKNGEGRTDPNAKLVCYKAVPRKGQPKHVKVTGLFINNQFGPDELDTVKESEFCIPAFDIPPPG